WLRNSQHALRSRQEETFMSYRIAGIDVHKKMLAVVVSDVEVDGEYQFERVRYSSSAEHLRFLAESSIKEVKEFLIERMRSRSRAKPGIDICNGCCLELRAWNQRLRDCWNQYSQALGIKEEEQLVFPDRASE